MVLRSPSRLCAQGSLPTVPRESNPGRTVPLGQRRLLLQPRPPRRRRFRARPSDVIPARRAPGAGAGLPLGEPPLPGEGGSAAGSGRGSRGTLALAVALAVGAPRLGSEACGGAMASDGARKQFWKRGDSKVPGRWAPRRRPGRGSGVRGRRARPGRALGLSGSRVRAARGVRLLSGPAPGSWPGSGLSGLQSPPRGGSECPGRGPRPGQRG